MKRNLEELEERQRKKDAETGKNKMEDDKDL